MTCCYQEKSLQESSRQDRRVSVSSCQGWWCRRCRSNTPGRTPCSLQCSPWRKDNSGISTKVFTHLETLQQQIFSLKLIEPIGVDDEDTVVDDVSERGTDDEEPSAMEVRPRSSKQGIYDTWDGLRISVYKDLRGDILFILAVFHYRLEALKHTSGLQSAPLCCCWCCRRCLCRNQDLPHKPSQCTNSGRLLRTFPGKMQRKKNTALQLFFSGSSCWKDSQPSLNESSSWWEIQNNSVS